MHLFQHIRHHLRAYVAGTLGAVTYIAMAALGNDYKSLRITAAGDVFFASYIGSTVPLLCYSTSALLRQRARLVDESLPVIFLLTAFAATVGLTDIFQLLHDQHVPVTIRISLGISTVVLAWTALHLAAAFHYAHLFHRNLIKSEIAAQNGTDIQSECQVGGLIFPGNDSPELWDFLYFSFVVGMTAQVSDVQVSNSRIRVFVLVHGVASFFFNTVILALAVNVAAGVFA
jgi:uncharacterized membrane protein